MNAFPSYNSARIICQRTPVLGTDEEIAKYIWEGRLNQYVLLFYGDEKQFPWPLIKIAEIPEQGRAVFIRKDVNWWWITAIRIWLGQQLKVFLIKCRATGRIWGLTK